MTPTGVKQVTPRLQSVRGWEFMDHFPGLVIQVLDNFLMNPFLVAKVLKNEIKICITW